MNEFQDPQSRTKVEHEVACLPESKMNKPIKLAAWTLLIAAALWIAIATFLSIGQPRHWQPNPEIGHRAAHKSGNQPP